MTDPDGLQSEEWQRYARQLNLREVGEAGQRKLKNARVLCLGAGGLGSPAALYLAAAGIGTLGLIDADEVDLTNLHRQLLHGTADVGTPKVISAQRRLGALNDQIKLEIHRARLTAENAIEFIKGYDIVVDGSDNLATRYLSNDVCVWEKKPNIYGSVHQWEGQASVFAPHLGGPCYRCLFPEPPPPEAIPSCAEAGVVGVMPGIIGTLQALETIKLILGVGDSLLGRLLHIDALTLRFREFCVRKDPACPVCGDSPRITAPIDYEQFCGTASLPAVQTISVDQLRDWLAEPGLDLIDVREPFEYEIAHIAGSRLIPMGQVAANTSEFAKGRKTVVMCKTGVRSANAIEFLQEQGLTELWNLEGGIEAWRRQIDPSLRKY